MDVFSHGVDVQFPNIYGNIPDALQLLFQQTLELTGQALLFALLGQELDLATIKVAHDVNVRVPPGGGFLVDADVLENDPFLVAKPLWTDFSMICQALSRLKCRMFIAPQTRSTPSGHRLPDARISL